MIVYYPIKRKGDFVMADGLRTHRVTIAKREIENKGYDGFIWNDLSHRDKQKILDYLNLRFATLGITVEYDYDD
ncbi:hypothetical protein BH09BAC4_BH09BAC4_24000 [soil metagenome]